MFKRTMLAVALIAGISDEISGQTGPVPDSFHKDLPTLRSQARKLLDVVETEGARAFLNSTFLLEPIKNRSLWWNKKPARAYSDAEYSELAEEEKEGLSELVWGTKHYYAPDAIRAMLASSAVGATQPRITSSRSPGSNCWRASSGRPASTARSTARNFPGWPAAFKNGVLLPSMM